VELPDLANDGIGMPICGMGEKDIFKLLLATIESGRDKYFITHGTSFFQF